MIAVLAVSLFISVTNPKTETIEKRTSDTIRLIEKDTIPFYKPKYITKRDTDTIYVPVPSGEDLRLIFSQKFYRGSQYEAWVSGYNPSLDSLKVFNNTITNTINNEVLRYVYPRTTDLYLNVGTMIIGGEFAPNIGASLKFRNDLNLGGIVGIYDKKPYYGISFGFKLNNRK